MRSLALDMSPSYIQKMMEGKYAPSMSKLFEIANHFHVPVAFLFIKKTSLIQKIDTYLVYLENPYQEIDTYLVYLENPYQEIVLNLTRQLVETTPPQNPDTE